MNDDLKIFIIGTLMGSIIGMLAGGFAMWEHKANLKAESYSQCVETYKDCDVDIILPKLAENGDIYLSNFGSGWYIRYEMKVNSGLEYNFKTDNYNEPIDALYDVLEKIEESGIEIK